MKQHETRRSRRRAVKIANGIVPDKSVLKDELRVSYMSYELLARFYDWAAAQSRDDYETTGETIIEALSITRDWLRFLFERMHEIDCGTVIVGRKGHKTRFRWYYSLRSIGQVAQGKADDLEEVDPEVMADAVNRRKSTRVNTLPESEMVLTIAEAKRRLGETFGVPPDAIEIIIRG